jgi:ribose-phosphate pyrophosphokinase
MRRTKILAGSSHGELSKLITERLGMRPANVNVKQFANHETALEIDVSVRGEDVFLIQSGGDNINDYLMELLIMANACKMASARRITAIIPYFPYSKQSKKKKMRGCITAKLIADMLQVAGVQHVITMDLHSSQIGGFFHISTLDNLFAEPSFARFIKEKIPDYTNGVVVSKNAGGAKR